MPRADSEFSRDRGHHFKGWQGKPEVPTRKGRLLGDWVRMLRGAAVRCLWEIADNVKTRARSPTRGP